MLVEERLSAPITHSGKDAASPREISAWVIYHFANSGFSAVVLTAVFNAFFVNVIAKGAGFDQGTSTLLWTLVIAVANLFVVASAPALGALADYSAAKKKILLVATIGGVIFTALLSLTAPGTVVLASGLLIAACLMCATAEDMIAAFLPEISTTEKMGRTSAYGCMASHLGCLLVLGLCLAYVSWAQSMGQTEAQFVPMTMIIVAAIYAVFSVPIFLWLKERAVEQHLPQGQSLWQHGFIRLKETMNHARHFQDLFRFLATLLVYSSGTATVVVLAAVYAQQVMGFKLNETIIMILLVNLTAAIGAFAFGFVQDKLGSKPTLAITLVLWCIAILMTFVTTDKTMFWVAANLIGVAMGSSYSVGRALVGQFSPPDRAGEFFGLWGLAMKTAAIIGPISYGLITYLSAGNHRMAIASTAAFFIIGLIMLTTVNERRGREAALTTK
ncbi:MAG: MFS transporter [Candidatus Obscuribacterales bacterium]|nr:MFS transporter [Candidatus Obscuribacterales bacterium]